MTEITPYEPSVELIRPFEKLNRSLGGVAAVVDHMDHGLAVEIVDVSLEVVELEINEAEFLVDFFEAVRGKHQLDLDSSVFEVGGLFYGAIDKQVEDIYSDIDGVHGLVEGCTFSATLIQPSLFGRVKELTVMQDGYRYVNTVSSPEKRFTRNIGKLTDNLISLVEAPSGELAQRALDLKQQKLQAQEAAILQARSGGPVRPISTKQKVDNGNYQLRKSKTRRAETPEAETEVVAGEMPDKLELKFDWMDEPSQFTVNTLDGVAVIDAIHDRVRGISDGIEKSDPTYTARFESLIYKHARKIASGSLPWTHRGNIKRSESTGTGVYGDATIWHSYDKTPNAPKIFYAVLPAPDEVTSVGGVEYMMVLLAKTDKAHEIETIVQVAGKTRKQLKSTKAGSI